MQGIQTRVAARWVRLKTTMNRHGYLQTMIHGQTKRVNRLVAANFIGNPLAYNEVHHINGHKTDNKVKNLRWGNAWLNAKDRRLHGNQIEGSKSPNAKLTESKVRVILEKRQQGISLNTLARENGVSKKLILLIAQGRIWKHVKR